jgi:CheY-like chemotaxis protein
MARKRALVVDDSKSARVILSRMLEKYDIEVDMAESAEQAIEYLKSYRPDAIFMDHLMPGMDGLQAVQAIKGNPQTAMIPIMMYTSEEGERYVGQARALGALGVLPKQVRPVDVSKVLYELHLLPERRDMSESALAPMELEDGTPIARPHAGARSRAAIGPNASNRRSRIRRSTYAASSSRASIASPRASSTMCAARCPRRRWSSLRHRHVRRGRHGRGPQALPRRASWRPRLPRHGSLRATSWRNPERRSPR